MQKWEYCVVGPIRSNFTGVNPIHILITESGQESKRIFSEKGLSEYDALAKVIAKLGNEGWDMVGCANAGIETHLLYFKRLQS